MYRRRLIIFFLLLATMAGLSLFARPYLSLDALVDGELWLRQAATARPLVVLGTAFVAYVALTLVPGLAGKSVVFGWLLGFLPGLLVVNCGLTIAALIMFLLSRHLLRDGVQSKFGWLIHRLDRGLRQSQAGFLLSLRLLHAPFTVTNYAAGATRVGTCQFWWTTQLGLLPGNIAFVLAGASLPSLRELKEQGLWSFVDLPLLIGLTLIGLLPILIHWLARHYQPASRYESGTCEAGAAMPPNDSRLAKTE